MILETHNHLVWSSLSHLCGVVEFNDFVVLRLLFSFALGLVSSLQNSLTKKNVERAISMDL